MFGKVLIGVDERPGGRDAIALAKHLVADDGELVLAYVHYGDLHPTRGSSPAFAAAEGERSRGLLASARAAEGIEASLVWTGSPAVGRGLHELAERQGADLVVVGSSGRGLLGRVAVGDHTRDALNGAPCAVAVAPAGYAQRPSTVRKIGVGYDGSLESKHALAAARELAARLEGKVSAFEAVTLPLDAGNVGALDQLVESARSAIAELGDVEAHAAYGDPAEELALFGASVDLLVVGSRGYGPIGRLVHGSTSQRLVRFSPVPGAGATPQRRWSAGFGHSLMGSSGSARAHSACSAAATRAGSARWGGSKWWRSG